MTQPCKINLVFPRFFEAWDYRSYVERGIGGSETCACEAAWRLARRGYDVTVFAWLDEGCDPSWRGTTWLPLEELDAHHDEEALWILFRSPALLDHEFRGVVWHMCQDEDYPGQWTPERAERIDVVMALCEAHAANLRLRHPEIAGKVWVTTNGCRVEQFEALEARGVGPRVPTRLVYASSPDRGLMQCASLAWQFVRELVPEAELHVYYGWDNIEKLLATEGGAKQFAQWAKWRDAWQHLRRQPGLFDHGRVGQEELYEAWLTSGVWWYPTQFTETSCITSMDAQAGGCVPVTSPIWALAENVRHGFLLPGDCWHDPLAHCDHARTAAHVAANPDLQEQLRPEMMAWARRIFHWERVMDQWEAWLRGYPLLDGGKGPYVSCEPSTSAVAQYAFQHRWATGSVLNAGCNIDGSDLRGRPDLDVVNLDVCAVDPGTGRENRVDVLADARDLRAHFADKAFDTVILGDILEHCLEPNALALLKEARRLARERIVITAPEDRRSVAEQQAGGGHEPTGEQVMYADGIVGWHPPGRPLTVGLLGGWLFDAGLNLARHEPIAYDVPGMYGHGVVAAPAGGE
jgi:glycosyltransferase involved in cell wall biosynthesis